MDDAVVGRQGTCGHHHRNHGTQKFGHVHSQPPAGIIRARRNYHAPSPLCSYLLTVAPNYFWREDNTSSSPDIVRCDTVPRGVCVVGDGR
jgi:hypothetical protein